jgi:DNA-binding NarL/FixJ family response regulator
MIKILIADDHAIVREGLKQIVLEEKDMKVAGEVGNVNDLLALLSKESFSILILDISMPGRSGLDALKEITTNYPHLPVLILSMYNEEQYGIRAIQSGASGYLIKYSAPGELIKAVRKIISGSKYISESLAEKLAWMISGGAKLPHEKLSDREYDIFCRIAAGNSAESIAEQLSISVHTVYSYRSRIMEKMEMHTNVELAQYALKNKLVE